MSLYVLGSSVAVKWALPEIGAAKALAFRDDVRNKIHEIIAPDVFPSEVAHALTKAERMKVIPIGDAKKHLVAILTAGPDLYPTFLSSLVRWTSPLPLESQSQIAFLSHSLSEKAVNSLRLTTNS